MGAMAPPGSRSQGPFGSTDRWQVFPARQALTRAPMTGAYPAVHSHRQPPLPLHQRCVGCETQSRPGRSGRPNRAAFMFGKSSPAIIAGRSRAALERRQWRHFAGTKCRARYQRRRRERRHQPRHKCRRSCAGRCASLRARAGSRARRVAPARTTVPPNTVVGERNGPHRRRLPRTTIRGSDDAAREALRVRQRP